VNATWQSLVEDVSWLFIAVSFLALAFSHLCRLHRDLAADVFALYLFSFTLCYFDVRN
jgi:hypothetical protein